jgi:hypothetical protein
MVVVNGFARRAEPVYRFLAGNAIGGPWQRLQSFLGNILFAP